MLSSESLLFALNSGCLNSHACSPSVIKADGRCVFAYTGSVRRLPCVLVVVSYFVEVVFVQLTDKAREVAMLEMLG